VKKPLVPLLVILFVASSVLSQKPVPQGIRQADAAEAQTQNNIPPPRSVHASIDAAKLRQEADELAKLAQTIPPAITQVQNGIVPKDIVENLKRIEKLSKNLRSQMNP
jgi:hypothetical protein